MADFFNAVSAVFVIFLLLGVGYLLGRLGWLTKQEKGFISKYVVNIAVPVNCVVGMMKNFSHDALMQAGIHLVVLGTDVDYDAVDDRGTTYEKHWIAQHDLDWLTEDLAKTELPVIICLHFGIAEDIQEGNYWFEACPEEGLIANRKELKEILKRSGNVRAVFSGHQHASRPPSQLGSLAQQV